MKKNILLTTLMAFLFLTGCGNKDVFDTTYTLKYPEIKMPSGEIVKGRVETWTDFEDGDSIQVIINGVTYITHISNVVLTTEEK